MRILIIRQNYTEFPQMALWLSWLKRLSSKLRSPVQIRSVPFSFTKDILYISYILYKADIYVTVLAKRDHLGASLDFEFCI